MFTAFICNEPAGESAGKSAKDRDFGNVRSMTSSSSTGQFSRTACDICRAKNLKCRGSGESCDECLASSSACTYTFSSGVGPGKKRRRRVRSPSLNAGFSQQRPITARSSLAQENEGGPQTRNTQSEERSNDWNDLLELPDVAAFTPTEPIRDDINISHTTPHATNDLSDMSHFGDGFVLCPGKQVSPITDPPPQLRSLLHSQPDVDVDAALRSNATSPIDPNILPMFEMPPSQMRGDASATRISPQSSFGQSVFMSEMLDLTPPLGPTPPLDLRPPFTPAQLLSDLSEVRRDNTGETQDKAFGQSYGSCGRCDCHASISQRLNELDLQRSSGIKVVPTDTLFLSVEKGLDQLSTMLSCNKCNVNDINPMLIVTHVNHLALTLSEIVHRLKHCQTPDTVPTVFRFGRYSVGNTKMRTGLLIGMIGLHVRSLNHLIAHLEKRIADQPRLLLGGASSIVTKMQQSLEALTSGSVTNFEN